MTVWRNLRSRASRTFFTVAGIAVGILALTVVGSLSERLATFVERATDINSGSIFAQVRPATFADARAQEALAADIRRLRAMPDVRRVIPEVFLPYGGAGGGFGPRAFILGVPDEAGKYAGRSVAIARGRAIAPGDRRAAIVGADFAAANHVEVGATIPLYGNSFHIVGVLGKSFTLFDSVIRVSFADAQALAPQVLPTNLGALPKNPISAVLVVPRDLATTALIVKRINVLGSLSAGDPAEFANGLRSTFAIFDGIIFGAAFIALVVAAFSIVNTMTIAVAERTREIGIRKAIGASDTDILREFVVEAAAIGLVGGLVGVGFGYVVDAVLDARASASGSFELFALSPVVGLEALAFAIVLAMLAGLWPALRAARLAPTEALRK